MSLVLQYAPVVHYDSREVYGTVAVESMTDNRYIAGPGAPYANALRRTDGTMIAKAGGDPPLTIQFLGASTYANGERVLNGDYLDAANLAYSADARQWWSSHGDVAYARQVPASDGRRRWLQYWFFYYFNAKQLHRLGLHEGDWEMVQIRLDEGGSPDAVTYAQHGKPLSVAWDEVVEDGRVPVYVALGSHASLPSPGRHPAPVIDDYCDGGGSTGIPAVVDISNEGPSWAAWPGRWGASAKRWPISFSSPEAPVTQRAWLHPDDFHREATEWAPRGIKPMTLGLRRPPSVFVAGTGKRRTVEFQVHGPDEATWVAHLTISASLAGDDPPREYIFDVTTAAQAEVEPVVATTSLDAVGREEPGDT